MWCEWPNTLWWGARCYWWSSGSSSHWNSGGELIGFSSTILTIKNSIEKKKKRQFLSLIIGKKIINLTIFRLLLHTPPFLLHAPQKTWMDTNTPAPPTPSPSTLSLSMLSTNASSFNRNGEVFCSLDEVVQPNTKHDSTGAPLFQKGLSKIH